MYTVSIVNELESVLPQNSDSTTAAEHVEAGHQLIEDHNSENYCDRCYDRDETETLGIVFQGAPCDFDICRACIDELLHQVTKPSHAKALGGTMYSRSTTNVLKP